MCEREEEKVACASKLKDRAGLTQRHEPMPPDEDIDYLAHGLAYLNFRVTFNPLEVAIQYIYIGSCRTAMLQLQQRVLPIVPLISLLCTFWAS